jgi:hypothetical protein
MIESINLNQMRTFEIITLKLNHIQNRIHFNAPKSYTSYNQHKLKKKLKKNCTHIHVLKIFFKKFKTLPKRIIKITKFKTLPKRETKIIKFKTLPKRVTKIIKFKTLTKWVTKIIELKTSPKRVTKIIEFKTSPKRVTKII